MKYRRGEKLNTTAKQKVKELNNTADNLAGVLYYWDWT